MQYPLPFPEKNFLSGIDDGRRIAIQGRIQALVTRREVGKSMANPERFQGERLHTLQTRDQG